MQNKSSTVRFYDRSTSIFREIPQELIRSAQGSEVNLNMEDHRDEEFKAQKKATKAFAGSGNRLGRFVKIQ